MQTAEIVSAPVSPVMTQSPLPLCQTGARHASLRQDANVALLYAEARAPRYTSYPTAVQFGPEVDEDVHREWLSSLRGGPPVSLYVHVPFCKRLCWYCGCNTRVANSADPITDYYRHLEQEVALVRAAIGDTIAVSALHLGGGSPDSLPVAELEQLFGALHGAFSFEPGAEIATELDPSYVTDEWIRTAAKHGLNRASLGVQDFDPAVQAAVNRPQSFERVAEVVSQLRAANVASVNLDLMYGLPLQTCAHVADTVDKALRLEPDRIAVFGYAHVPWMKLNQTLIHDEDLPGAADRQEQAEVAAERLTSAGYVRIGLDHFARPDDALARSSIEGRLHRNFQGYTPDAAASLIGLGASSISRLPQGYAQNCSSIVDWRHAIEAGHLPTARGVEFIGDDRLRADIIEELMCQGAVDLVALGVKHGADLRCLDSVWAPLERFEEQGLLTMDDATVRLTTLGRSMVRTVCTAFDRYFVHATGRHALAV